MHALGDLQRDCLDDLLSAHDAELLDPPARRCDADRGVVAARSMAQAIDVTPVSTASLLRVTLCGREGAAGRRARQRYATTTQPL